MLLQQGRLRQVHRHGTIVTAAQLVATLALSTMTAEDALRIVQAHEYVLRKVLGAVLVSHVVVSLGDQRRLRLLN